jgi:hypothetical protein
MNRKVNREGVDVAHSKVKREGVDVAHSKVKREGVEEAAGGFVSVSYLCAFCMHCNVIIFSFCQNTQSAHGKDFSKLFYFLYAHIENENKKCIIVL